VLLSESLELTDSAGGRVFSCRHCGQELGPVADNYKLSCLLEESALDQGNPTIADPAPFVDDVVVFRRFYCPGCAVLIETEVARPGDEPIRDIEIGGDA
jgi:N-methylhydantoinase B